MLETLEVALLGLELVSMNHRQYCDVLDCGHNDVMG